MPESWLPWWESFARFLRAENASPATLATYGQAIAQLGVFVRARGHRGGPLMVSADQVQDFMNQLLQAWKPATASNRYRGLRRFFNWLVSEQELEVSPMARLKPPRVPEAPPAVLGEEELRRLLKACEGTGFEDRRDAALIRLMVDAGARCGGVLSMRVAQLHLDEGWARIVAKGGDEYDVFFGVKAARDLDRYLRLRAQHRDRNLEELWLGQRGALTGSGLRRIIVRRARRAALEARVHPHLLRHTFAHMWKAAGGSEEDLMTAGGWRDPRSMRRYGKAAAVTRARLAHRRLSPGDRL
jgi:site-specific recombinase XerC